jgi:hypothetical protein
MFMDKPYKAMLLLTVINKEHNPYTQPTWPSDAFVRRFLAEIEKILPDVAIDRIHWAYHIFTGSIVHFLSAGGRIKRLSGGICHIDEQQEMRRRLLGLVNTLLRD